MKIGIIEGIKTRFNREKKTTHSSDDIKYQVPSKNTQFVFSALALTLVTLFACWWFRPIHLPQNFTGIARIFDVILFLLVSFIIFHPIIMEVLTWLISSHIKEVDQESPAPGLRVAFITTIVPASESLELLHKCLPAMILADYPHDTWLLDEGNSEEVKKICELYGVNHFSRHGNTGYNTKVGKFTRTKGGNHNSWYDAFGNDYDVVAQIDTDFVPETSFLTKTLGYFNDAQVAFVGTPQIYGNTENSLIARGAAEQQYNFYGSVLRGLSGMGVTLLIGANHVIRVSALKDVDHYSAHITEDLLTGMKLHSKGWKSVYLPYALAIGEGPNSWESYFNQQMRWAYGCMDILFNHSGKLFKKMNLRCKMYYFFLQQHYFSGIAMALSIILLNLYFFSGLRAADVDFFRFFVFYSFVLLTSWLMSVWLQHYHIQREDEGSLLLAGSIINVAAWPIWFIAFISVLIRKRLTYKVTPKGEQKNSSSSLLKVFFPHLLFGSVAGMGLIASLFTHWQSPAMIFWAVSSMLLMLFVPFAQRIEQTLTKWSTKVSNYLRKKLESSTELATHHTPIQTETEINQVESKEVERENIFGKYTALIDSIYIGLTVIASVILYVGRIGFYSDDWSFLGNFHLSRDQSLWGLIQTATTPNTFMRPVQNIYDAVLYWLFGTQPLGYHLVNTTVLIAIAVLFYFVLRQLKLPRIITIALPLVYILLPHYSTDRFWFASFQVNLSMLLYFFSLYAGLRALAVQTVRKMTWKFFSLLSVFLSILSYEVVVPLFLLNVLLYWKPIARLKSKNSAHQNNAVFILLNFISLSYVLLFKAKTTIRLSSGSDENFILYVINMLTSAFQVNYGTLGVHLPRTVWNIIEHYSDTNILLFGIMLGISIFCYLLFSVSEITSYLPSKKWLTSLVIFSFVVFFLGYAIFISNRNVGFSPTGVSNRVAHAAAIGVACSIVGGIGLISKFLRFELLSKMLFSAFIGFVCSLGFITTNSLAVFWIDAHEQQQIVLSDIRQHVPIIPSNSTLILDAVCPYIGPASVFEAQWDITGALQIQYNDPTLQANVVSPRLEVKEEGLHTTIYHFTQTYPYYPYNNLFIYNFKSKDLYPLFDAETANNYFQHINPQFTSNCPEGTEGHGVSIL